MTEPARAVGAASVPMPSSLRRAGRVRRVARERSRAVVEWLLLAAIVAAVYAFVPVAA
ncbi:hypothetical protein [Azohydromonas aeria]|uniref:hypothetical protein n=1 Tax=Azohydromonas aeria TaxID=2590212 RepID=UPI0012F986A9|nr:hypothetical protein [Azohydromonas aeria]